MVIRIFYAKRVDQITEGSNRRAQLDLQKPPYSLKLENNGVLVPFYTLKINNKRSLLTVSQYVLHFSLVTKQSQTFCLLANLSTTFSMFMATISSRMNTRYHHGRYENN